MMKHLKEYNDEDLEDLIGDLEEIGHEQLKGWILLGNTESGFSLVYIYFAHNNQELEKIIKDEYIRYINSPNFPVYDNGSYKRGSRTYESFFKAFSDFLSYEEIFMSSQWYGDLKPKNPSQKPGRIVFNGHNPYLTSLYIDKYLIGAKEKFTSKDEKDEFNEFLEIIPLDK